jgi:predicted nucleotidyltransferase
MSRPDQAFYLRQMAEIARLGVGHLQRELDRLVSAGIVRRFKQGRHVYFQADSSCPIFDELRGLVLKTLGAADVLRQALLPLGDRIHWAFIFGSLARREERSDSDIDLFVVGDVSLAEVVAAIRDAEQTLDRPVNPTVYPPAEFSSKLASRHHFVTKVMKREKLMLIGNENDIAAVSGK